MLYLSNFISFSSTPFSTTKESFFLRYYNKFLLRGLIDANGQATYNKVEKVIKFLEQDVDEEKNKGTEGERNLKKKEVLQEYNNILVNLQKHFDNGTNQSMNLQENSVKDPTVLSKFSPHFNPTATNLIFIYYHKIFCSFNEILFTFFINTLFFAKKKMQAKAILHYDLSSFDSLFGLENIEKKEKRKQKEDHKWRAKGKNSAAVDNLVPVPTHNACITQANYAQLAFIPQFHPKIERKKKYHGIVTYSGLNNDILCKDLFSRREKRFKQLKHISFKTLIKMLKRYTT
jgi:hypothetical protein